MGCLNLQYRQVGEWHCSDCLLVRPPIGPTNHPLVWPPLTILLKLYLNWRLQLVNQCNTGLVIAAKCNFILYFKTKIEVVLRIKKMAFFMFSLATDRVRTLHTVLTSQTRKNNIILTKNEEAQKNSHDWLQEAWKRGHQAARKHKQENSCQGLSLIDFLQQRKKQSRVMTVQQEVNHLWN